MSHLNRSEKILLMCKQSGSDTRSNIETQLAQESSVRIQEPDVFVQSSNVSVEILDNQVDDRNNNVSVEILDGQVDDGNNNVSVEILDGQVDDGNNKLFMIQESFNITDIPIIFEEDADACTNNVFSSPELQLMPEPTNNIVDQAEDQVKEATTLIDKEVDESKQEVDQEGQLKRKRRKKAEPEEWLKNKNKKCRMLGEKYMGYSKSKSGKVTNNTKRNARSLKSGCLNSTFCAKSSKRNCSSLSDNDRARIFELFWKMNWEQKKMYVLALVVYSPKKRTYVEGTSRRHGSFLYFLRLNDTRHQVCKKMFLSTLDLNEKMVHNWILGSQNHGLTDRAEDNNKKKSENRKKSPYALKSQHEQTYLNTFFDKLAKIESHYCRKDATKKYLQYPFKSKNEVYELYRKECEHNNRTPLAITTFKNMFENQNLGLYVPRKDQCDTCCQYKVKQLSEEDYKIHVEKKNQAQEEKKKEKAEEEKGNNYTFTMDVQAVKLCPVLRASSLYYKTRLQLHIFTIYNLATHQCTHYVCNEAEGDLQASVFISCILAHLQKHCLDDKRNIVLYSDGCGYQNRNSLLSKALSLFSLKHKVQVEQKWLEKGHTQMECDSAHALIERKLKGREITLPSQYVNIIREARKQPMPFDVEYLSHHFFKNYNDKALIRFGSIRPGKVKDDPTVSKLRCMKYSRDGKLQYKINYSDEYEDLPQRYKKVQVDFEPKPLFSHRLPIKYSRWNHLQELKTVMSEEVHSFYDGLPHDN